MANNPTHESIAMATFDTTDDAEQAVEALHDANFTSDKFVTLSNTLTRIFSKVSKQCSSSPMSDKMRVRVI